MRAADIGNGSGRLLFPPDEGVCVDGFSPARDRAQSDGSLSKAMTSIPHTRIGAELVVPPPPDYDEAKLEPINHGDQHEALSYCTGRFEPRSLDRGL